MRTLFLIFMALAMSASLFGATHIVPDNHTTIQNAINAATSGDTVLVRQGAYLETIDFLGKDITVTSESGPKVTLIRGNQSGSVVTFNSAEASTSVLQGFTITNGAGTDISGDLYGGGIFCGTAASPTISYVYVMDNSADYGGGICGYGNSNPQITACIITGNIADYGGGVYFYDNSAPNITNCLFNWNYAQRGAGLEFNTSSPGVLNNCTVADNLSQTRGGGLSAVTTSYPVMNNSIFWNNHALEYAEAQLFNVNWGKAYPYYCNIQGGYPTAGSNNIDADPLFADTRNGKYHLKQAPAQPGVTNPCVDAGSDLASNLGMSIYWTRTDQIPDLGVVDMGFHYGLMLNYPEGDTIKVPADYSSIQQAIDSAEFLDTVLVAPGTYVENIDFKGKAICVQSEQGPANTIIDGNHSGSAVTFQGNELQNSILDGFTILNGAGTDLSGQLYGGGILCSPSAHPLITNNVVIKNSADYGGGLYLSERSCPMILHNIFTSNSAVNDGGGLMADDHSRPDIINNLFDWNVANRGAGLNCHDKSYPLIRNATIADNTAWSKGGGLMASKSSHPTIYDSIIWNNKARDYDDAQVHHYDWGSAYIYYTDIMGGFTGTGSNNIDLNPLFADPLNGNYLLQQAPCQPGIINPCVNAGSCLASECEMADLFTRTDGVPDMGQVDMGFHLNGTVTPYVGDTIKIPQDYSLIQQAIDTAFFRDLLLVAPGTYQENLDFKGKAIRLESEQGPQDTYIDGGQTGSVVFFDNLEIGNSIVDGFTLINGSGADVGGDLYGGGVFCGEYTGPSLIHNIIRNNTADYGGGIGVYNRSCPLVQDNAISGNTAMNNGGGMIISNHSRPDVINNIVDWNMATNGGGIDFYDKSYPYVTNLTVAFNTAASKGGGLSVGKSAHPYIYNTIVWDNNSFAYSDPQIHNYNWGSPYMYFSNIQGGYTGNGSDNINKDPLFFNSLSGDYHLKQDPCQPKVMNPCVDAGNDTALNLGLHNHWTRTDKTPDSGMADMGFHYSNSISSHEGEILNVPSVFPTIQQAIDGAKYRDVVLVAPGTYYENLDFKGKAVVVKSAQGAALTTLDGGQAGTVVTFINNEMSNSVLQGFTITNGSGTDVGGELCGGGAFCGPYTRPAFVWNIFKNNSADLGGGLYMTDHACPRLENNVFTQNAAVKYGGGVHATEDSRPQMVNTLMDKNTADFGGGMDFDEDAEGLIIYLVMTDNTAVDSGGGFSMRNGAHPSVYNAIIWGNQAGNSQYDQHYAKNWAWIMLYNSIYQGYYPHTGKYNLNADPLFKDAPNGDYRLTWNSPAINIGSKLNLSDDMDGVARPHMGTPDAGLYEFTGDHTLVADSFSVSATGMDSVNFLLDAGPGHSGYNYLIFASVTGCGPGIPLPGGPTVPVNWDFFTVMCVNLANSPMFVDFLGTLDPLGQATAKLSFFTVLPPEGVGMTLSFAFGCAYPWDFASTPINIEITP